MASSQANLNKIQRIGKITLAASCCYVMTSKFDAVRLHPISQKMYHWLPIKQLHRWTNSCLLTYKTRLQDSCNLPDLYKLRSYESYFLTHISVYKIILDFRSKLLSDFGPYVSNMNLECKVNLSCNCQLAPNFFWVNSLICLDYP